METKKIKEILRKWERRGGRDKEGIKNGREKYLRKSREGG